MKLQAAIKKIKQRAKIVGIKVDIHEEKRKRDSAFNIRFENSNRVISFYSGRSYSDDENEEHVHLIKVTRDGDVSDIHTDYFAEAATGGNYKLLNPSQQSHAYSPYYSERDLEFVS